METQNFAASKVLFVRNLPPDTTKLELVEAFEKYGKVEKTLIML
jgi:RNA recognition motif-containing protein